MRKRNSGFTLIELVMVIVILGILAASFAPKFLDMSTEATTATQKAAHGAVKSALTVYVGKNKGTFPSLTQLADTVDGGVVDTVNTPVEGVEVDIDGTKYLITTFLNADCTGAMVDASSVVQCVDSF